MYAAIAAPSPGSRALPKLTQQTDRNYSRNAATMMTAAAAATTTRSHPEMVSDMSHVTLNHDLSKIPFEHF